MAEAVHGPQPAFEGDSLDLLRAVMRGQIKPDPVQMTAAMALLRFEHPQLQAVAIGGGSTLESLVRASLPDGALNNRITELLDKAKPLIEVEPAAEAQADALAALWQRAVALEAQIAASGDDNLRAEYEEARQLLADMRGDRVAGG